MTRGSTATRRQHALADAATAAGAMVAHGESITVTTSQRVEIVDVTDTVMALVRRAPVLEGQASICSLHTTCTVCLNEYQPALVADIASFLERLVERDGPWRHNDPAHSDCDRLNADSHLRALLLGHSLALQVSGGELVLGQWQRILVVELDGPRPRNFRVSLLGVGRE